jgi:hypothetical protein
MAKKETRSASTSRRKAPAAKSAAKPAAKGPAPLVDTALAASAAAAFVGNRVPLNPAAASGPRKESASFKHLKESIARPHTQGLADILETSSTQKKANLPFSGGLRQVGRNQTYGADVTRTGVPRRNAG